MEEDSRFISDKETGEQFGKEMLFHRLRLIGSGLSLLSGTGENNNIHPAVFLPSLFSAVVGNGPILTIPHS